MVFEKKFLFVFRSNIEFECIVGNFRRFPIKQIVFGPNFCLNATSDFVHKKTWKIITIEFQKKLFP